jgi:hypothetical protein
MRQWINRERIAAETVTVAIGDEAAACATRQFQRVGHNVCKRFRLRARQHHVEQRRNHSHQRPVQNEMAFDPPAHPERSQEAHDEGSGRRGVMQEILAEMKSQRNNCENQSHFRQRPPEQNSSPVDFRATHFPNPVPHLKRSAIAAINAESFALGKSRCGWRASPPATHSEMCYLAKQGSCWFENES